MSTANTKAVNEVSQLANVVTKIHKVLGLDCHMANELLFELSVQIGSKHQLYDFVWLLAEVVWSFANHRCCQTEWISRLFHELANCENHVELMDAVFPTIAILCDDEGKRGILVAAELRETIPQCWVPFIADLLQNQDATLASGGVMCAKKLESIPNSLHDPLIRSLELFDGSESDLYSEIDSIGHMLQKISVDNSQALSKVARFAFDDPDRYGELFEYIPTHMLCSTAIDILDSNDFGVDNAIQIVTGLGTSANSVLPSLIRSIRKFGSCEKSYFRDIVLPELTRDDRWEPIRRLFVVAWTSNDESDMKVLHALYECQSDLAMLSTSNCHRYLQTRLDYWTGRICSRVTWKKIEESELNQASQLIISERAARNKLFCSFKPEFYGAIPKWLDSIAKSVVETAYKELVSQERFLVPLENEPIESNRTMIDTRWTFDEEDLEIALRDLSELERKCLTLQAEGHSQVDIAQCLGINVWKVEYAISTGRKKARVVLETLNSRVLHHHLITK